VTTPVPQEAYAAGAAATEVYRRRTGLTPAAFDHYVLAYAAAAVEAVWPLAFEAGRATVRAEVAAEIRNRTADVMSRAEALAGASDESHPFALGAEWAARIAEGKTDTKEETK